MAAQRALRQGPAPQDCGDDRPSASSTGLAWRPMPWPALAVPRVLPDRCFGRAWRRRARPWRRRCLGHVGSPPAPSNLCEDEAMSFQISRLLYATDLSAHSPDVFRKAIGIAERFGAAVHLLHVVEDPALLKDSLASRYTAVSPLDNYRERATRQAIDEIKRRLEDFGHSTLASEDSYHASLKEIHVRIGKPSRIILQEADRIDADCIVMGTQRQSGLGHMVLGSVARKISRRTRRPLFLFPV
ncbi:hypothetical protein C6W88_04150 [Halomonas litopenaei]|uniref:UspA domain-containing protein n=2 Tax=Halomonadaceae TaxID=28256 RepID=A0ABX5J4G9_9GAMM|nr:hypothetical protein C6W89_01015 [Halomonas sp. SYSU XM8]PTL96569.1 hypothetical protein C6W88_04150 [Halomonas litopenaei]